MDMSIGENEPLTVDHIKWLGFIESEKDTFVHSHYPIGIIQDFLFFWVYEDGSNAYGIKTKGDANKVYMKYYTKDNK